MPPEASRPVRLTFPSYDVGAARIMAGDAQVGHVLGEFWCWRAYLWTVADDRSYAYSGKQVTGKRLADVREKLREQVEVDGPWWVAGHPDGLESAAGSEIAATEEKGGPR